MGVIRRRIKCNFTIPFAIKPPVSSSSAAFVYDFYANTVKFSFSATGFPSGVSLYSMR